MEDYLKEKFENQEIEEEMISLLLKESELKIDINAFKNKRELLNILMLLRPVGNLSEDFLSLQNKYLQTCKNAKHKITFEEIKKNKTELKSMSEVINVETDVLLNFSFSLFSNACDIENFDNQIVVNGGLQIREDFANEFIQLGNKVLFNNPYIVNGYNLNCKHIAKIIVPKSKLFNEDINSLKHAVDELLNFAKVQKLKTFVVCLKDVGVETQNCIVEILNKKINKNKIILIK